MDTEYAIYILSIFILLYMYVTVIWFLFIWIMIIWITNVHLEFIYHKKDNFVTVCDPAVVKPIIDL